MRNTLRSGLVVAALLVVAGVAQAQTDGTAQGLGGFSVGQLAEPTPSLGGTITVAVAEHVHVLGEAGRLGNVLPPLASASLV